MNFTERSLVREQVRRGNITQALADTLTSQRVFYFTSEPGPFTTAVVISSEGAIFAGSTKRISYAPRADENDPSIGRAIALTRAIRSNGQSGWVSHEGVIGYKTIEALYREGIASLW